MRVAVLAAFLLLTACATETTHPGPPPGVDFSGHWKLNAADSDDPLHLLQIANGQGNDASGNAGGSGGRGGRGGQGTGYPSVMPPQTPSVSALGAGLRWPGKLLEVQQAGGVVTFSSNGRNRVCQPSSAPDKKKPKHYSSSDRDAPLRSGRDELPPICTWSDNTLVVRSGEPDEDRPPYEERYSISPDGQRLFETVGFRGGRSNGFTMSRVWDKVPQ
jgi:hypothetical protein